MTPPKRQSPGAKLRGLYMQNENVSNQLASIQHREREPQP